MSSETQVGGEAVKHRTPAGRASMDPAKWRVAQVIHQHMLRDGSVSARSIAYAIFPPHAFLPTLAFRTHEEAMNRAQKYGYFKVIPPQEDSEF